MNENVLECIVRFHDIRRLAELERCIFSLVNQSYRPLKIILLLQRFSSIEIAKVRQMLAPLLGLRNAPAISLHNWEQPEPYDGRTHLLNLGLSLCSGRYLAFLDYDDTLFPMAYDLLVASLRKSDAAIAFATVQCRWLRVYDQFFYTEGEAKQFYGKTLWDLFNTNFCPLHSYVLDREKIPPEMLFFDTSLTIEEDYDFLLRICAQCKSDFTLLGTPIGNYYFKTDGSNTVATDKLDSVKSDTYKAVCMKIESRRRSTRVSLSVQALMGISDPNENLTISDVLNSRILAGSKSPFKIVKFFLHPIYISYNAILAFMSDSGKIKPLIKRAYSIYRLEGFSGVNHRIRILINRNL